MSKKASVKVELYALEDIKPYPNNPRDNDIAVTKVISSIRRYGYVNPIIVDTAGVVIAGHTRLKALTALKYKEVQVVVLDIDEQQAKELRIIDNKAAEYAEWNDDLIFELREIIDPAVIKEFFPEIKIDGEWKALNVADVTNEQLAQKQDAMDRKFTDGFETDRHNEDRKIMVDCPHCHETVTLLKSDVTNGNLVKKERFKNGEA